jgi:hypothetical protein
MLLAQRGARLRSALLPQCLLLLAGLILYVIGMIVEKRYGVIASVEPIGARQPRRLTHPEPSCHRRQTVSWLGWVE